MFYKSESFKTHFPRNDFAELLNMSVENLMRTIKELSEDKIVKFTGNHVEILDMERLKI